MSETAVVGDCIGAALVSLSNLDHGLMDNFGDSKYIVDYGTVRLQPLAYQDDIMRSRKDVRSTQVGIIKLAAMMDGLEQLEAHSRTNVFYCLWQQKI